MYLNCYEHWRFTINYKTENKCNAKEFINSKFVNSIKYGCKVFKRISCFVDTQDSLLKIHYKARLSYKSV
jgi:hypothetical protein